MAYRATSSPPLAMHQIIVSTHFITEYHLYLPVDPSISTASLAAG